MGLGMSIQARSAKGRLRPAQTVIAGSDDEDGVGAAGFGYTGDPDRTIVRRRYQLGRNTYYNAYWKLKKEFDEFKAQTATK